MPFIVCDVPREFVGPELPVAMGGGCAFASLVPVPEAAMDEHHSLVFRQDDVRLAGEGGNIEPETVSRAVQQAADDPLRAGVLAPDLRHVPATLGFGKGVRHDPRIAGMSDFHNDTDKRHEKGTTT